MAKKKIVSFENLKSFKEKLDSATEIELAKKQDNLVSGTNIKTVAGQDITGAGNIDIDTLAPKITIGDKEYSSKDGDINLPTSAVGAVGIDDVVTADSQNLIRSGAVYNAISSVSSVVVQDLTASNAFTITAQDWEDLKTNHYIAKTVTIDGLKDAYEFVNIQFTVNETAEYVKLIKNKATQYIGMINIEENDKLFEIVITYKDNTVVLFRCAQVY